MIKVYKTFELTDAEWRKIIDGFNDSFSECQTVERMKVNYSCSVLGYSYHALDLTEDGAIRGYNSIVPTQYLYQGKKIIVGISGGTYVNKEFRKDVFIFKHLMDALFIYCRNEGMVMKVGVPNKNSFKYTLILNKAKMVGYLNYYILPVHFFNLILKKRLGFLNALSAILMKTHFYFISLLNYVYNSKGIVKPLEIICNNDFYNIRYKSRGRYFECKRGNLIGYYRVCEEEGKQVVYIMDFKENGRKSLKSLLFVTKQVFLREKGVDAIMYVGTMNLRQPLLFKVPHRMDPKPLPLTINVISDDETLEATALDFTSWDFSLQNFDVR